MKPTTRHSIERRLEAMETTRATNRTPELRLILNKVDGTQEIHILGKEGKVIVPAKLSPEQWAASAKKTGRMGP